MENNDLKERIRKNVKERIAVSNIREEFDMKNNKNKKMIYWITSSVAVVVLCVGIVINYNNPISKKTKLGKTDNSNIEELKKEKTDAQENDTIIFNTESIKTVASISGKWEDIDGDWKDTNLTELFGFIKNIEILERYDNFRQGMVYVKENPKDENYSKLQQYELIYSMDGNNAPSVEISFTKEDKILKCMIPDANDFLSSTISGNNVKLFKTEHFEDKSKINGEAFFEHNGYKFYIESHKIDENDFISIVKSILDQNIISNDVDKDINVNEQTNEKASTNYPSYYAGKYVDNNGNNVILLCEDNGANRKEICSLLGITESKTIFKTAKYSYNYLTSLQNKISKKMIDKEFTFVTLSAVMENSNNIKVTVTSNNETDLNKIKALDAIGGAIDIEYNTNSSAKKDLLIEKE